MNPNDRNPPTSDDRRFDLLVDGELSEAARRDLLSGLDDEPGGWRRCALAFLEAQSWRQAFGAVVSPPKAKSPPKRSAGWFRFGGPAGTLLAMAASFAMALILGAVVETIWSPGTPGLGSGGPDIAAQTQGGTPGGNVGRHETSPDSSPGKPEGGPPKVWRVELPGTAGPGGERQTIPLLAEERDQVSENWLQSLPTPLSPDVLEQLQKAGLRVEQRRRLLPWRMKDGRRLVVPVDEVELHYVGSPTL
jgi:hypothetical protein